MRLQVDDAGVRAKAWATTETEPSSWLVELTYDMTPIVADPVWLFLSGTHIAPGETLEVDTILLNPICP